jgi:hypothetical protein
MNTKHLNQLLLTQIEEKMKMKNGKMSPESVLQILKACSSNYYDVKLHERILCDKLLMLANNWLEDFDFNQRSELAVAIAKLRFDINPPRFFYPQSLDLILKSLSVSQFWPFFLKNLGQSLKLESQESHRSDRIILIPSKAL